MIEVKLWNTLLTLKREIEQYPHSLTYCCFSVEGVVQLNEHSAFSNQTVPIVVAFEPSLSGFPPANAQFQWTGAELRLLYNHLYTDAAINFLKTYLPFCFLPLLAKKYQRTISIAHFAQTLDGKIATSNGHSKWIGNQENLIHAHRMRALCDGILIGNKTLAADQPKLTVRHVAGKNPQRIVLGTSCTDFSSLTQSDSSKIIVIGSPHHQWNGCLDYVQLDKVDGIIPPKAILKKLYQKNINSIYIEGGASTTSCFIHQKAVDILQLHIAPLLFGSGKSGINLPAISQVEEAIQFKDYQFHQIGNEIMFTGHLHQNGQHD